MIKELIDRAVKAKDMAYAPYSGFRVGACVLSRRGGIYCGANVENASFSLTICAERAAIFRAVFEGDSEIEAIAIATDAEDFVYPCGACRQVIAEFSNNPRIIMVNRKGETKTVEFVTIFPNAFEL